MSVRDVLDDDGEVANEPIGREPGGNRRVGREPGHQLPDDGVGLVDRREIDGLARLREGPDWRSRSDSLIGRAPDVGGSR